MSYRFTEAEFSAMQARRTGVKLAKVARQPSMIEEQFAEQLKSLDIPAPVRNYRAIDGRKFEFDFAWPAKRFAVEIQGNAHRIKSKFKADIKKRYLSMRAGWRVLEVGGDEVRSGEAIIWLQSLWGPESREVARYDLEGRN